MRVREFAGDPIQVLRLRTGEFVDHLRHAIAQAMADAGMDLNFLVAQVLGKRYTAVIGLPSKPF